MRTICRRPESWVALVLMMNAMSAVACSSWDGSCGCLQQCEVKDTTPVAWTGETALGTPELLFSPFAGTCQAPFQWNADGGSEFTIDPPQGQSTLTATVTVDPSSARLVTYDHCPDALVAGGTVTLELPEGSVADRRPIALSASPVNGSAAVGSGRLTFAMDEQDFGSWLSIRKSDPERSIGMTVEVTALERGCSGDIQLRWTRATGNTGVATIRRIATWSDTGCGTGQSAVPLDHSWQGIDLAATVASFSQVDVPGTWTDGSTTTLSLALSLLESVACAETTGNGFTTVLIPTNVVAGTADGRVRGLSGQGTIRATVKDGTLWQMQLSLSTESVCASQEQALPYAAASCTSASGVRSQLDLSLVAINPPPERGSLGVWVLLPGASAASTDGWDRLTLKP